jgi:hypothetical protein
MMSLLGAAFIGFAARAAWLYPLWLSAPEVRSWILKQVPLGSSVEQVERLIRDREWIRNYEWKSQPSQSSEKLYPGVRGGWIIGADLGGYRGVPFYVDLDAYWGFDESGKLIDLKVRRVVDAL